MLEVHTKKRNLKHHILPNPIRKKRATLLSHYFLAFYALIVFTTIQAFNRIPQVSPGVLSYAANINFSDLLDETNKMREKYGYKPLKVNQKLSVAAFNKANHMFKNNYWAHVAPDGTQPWYFILSQGYDYVYAGENLAKNFNNSRDVVEAWYKSPSHRENLLNSNYDEIGFAVVNGTLEGYETTLVVQMFGRTKSPNYLATEENVQGESIQEVEEIPAVALAPSATEEPLPAMPVNPQPSNQANSEEIVVYSPLFTIQDVNKLTRTVSIAMGGFLVSLLTLDMWYSKRKNITKISGHTIAHILFLTVAVLSILYLIRPGIVL